MTEFEIETRHRDALQAECDRHDRRMHELGAGTGNAGKTPDHIFFSPEFQDARRSYARAFDNLRAFNGTYTKRFKKEIRAAIHAKRVAAAV